MSNKGSDRYTFQSYASGEISLSLKIVIESGYMCTGCSVSNNRDIDFLL